MNIIYINIFNKLFIQVCQLEHQDPRWESLPKKTLSNKRIYMRDCDWWRCKDGKIIENWCMVDTLHLAHQLGRDILSEISQKP